MSQHRSQRRQKSKKKAEEEKKEALQLVGDRGKGPSSSHQGIKGKKGPPLQLVGSRDSFDQGIKGKKGEPLPPGYVNGKGLSPFDQGIKGKKGSPLPPSFVNGKGLSPFDQGIKGKKGAPLPPGCVNGKEPRTKWPRKRQASWEGDEEPGGTWYAGAVAKAMLSDEEGYLAQKQKLRPNPPPYPLQFPPWKGKGKQEGHVAQKKKGKGEHK